MQWEFWKWVGQKGLLTRESLIYGWLPNCSISAYAQVLDETWKQFIYFVRIIRIQELGWEKKSEAEHSSDIFIMQQSEKNEGSWSKGDNHALQSQHHPTGLVKGDLWAGNRSWNHQYSEVFWQEIILEEYGQHMIYLHIWWGEGQREQQSWLKLFLSFMPYSTSTKSPEYIKEATKRSHYNFVLKLIMQIKITEKFSVPLHD